MKRIADFFDWLFAYHTPSLFPVLFVVGGVLTILFAIVMLFVIEPLLGFLFCAALFFGVPYVAYRIDRAKEQDE